MAGPRYKVSIKLKQKWKFSLLDGWLQQLHLGYMLIGKPGSTADWWI
jgi:hypothetical protein